MIATPPTTPPTMPPVAPPERPASGLGCEFKLGVDVVDTVDADESVDAVVNEAVDEVADEAADELASVADGSRSARLAENAVADGLAELSEEYVLFSSLLDRFATGFDIVLQQMLTWFLVTVHSSLWMVSQLHLKVAGLPQTGP
jgi:hypothetical protein